MQSQIREVMNQSTPSLAPPPGHGIPEYVGSQNSASYGQTYQYGGHNASMINDEKLPRPSTLKTFQHFSSRFSTTSYMGAHQKDMTPEQQMKREDHAMQVSQKSWLDRQRQNKRFALYTFLGLNGLMILVIILTAVVWVCLHLVKKHSTVGIPVNQNLQTVSS